MEGTAAVKVKALGILTRRLPGGGPTLVPFPASGTLAVRDVICLTGVPDDEIFMVVVNGRRAALDHVLGPGDEVTLIPPVAGG